MDMAAVVDVEQLVLLLELSPPFGKKEVQTARRTMAKRWHPDLAPIGNGTISALIDRQARLVWG